LIKYLTQGSVKAKMAKTNQELLIEFYEKNGLNPNRNVRIVELGTHSVEESFTLVARRTYDQVFLVSEFITGEDLKRYNMENEGANGCLRDGELSYTSGPANSHVMPYEERSSIPGGLSKKTLIVPSIDEFDTIIALQSNIKLSELLKLPNNGEDHQLFIGFIAPMELLKQYVCYYKEFADNLTSRGSKCDLIQDGQFGLIRRR
jgi:hypothetical protein